MKQTTVTLLIIVLLFFCLTNCQKEAPVKEWIPFKVQVNPVKVTGERSGESQNMDLLVNQTIQALENRFKLFAVKNIKISEVPNAEDQLLIEIPQQDIMVSRGKKKFKISPFHLVAYLCAYPAYKIELKLCTAGPLPVKEVLLEHFSGTIPDNMEIVSKRDELGRIYYTVLKDVVVSSQDFIDGRVILNQYGEPGLQFKLKPAGADRLREFSSKNIGKKLAILLDGRLIMAPTIADIVSEEVKIMGALNPTLVSIMAALMNTGPLPDALVLPSSVKVFDLKIGLKFQVVKKPKK